MMLVVSSTKLGSRRWDVINVSHVIVLIGIAGPRTFSSSKLSVSHRLPLDNPTLLLAPDRQETSNGTTTTFQVFDPAKPHSVIANVPAMNRIDALLAIHRSHSALPSWKDETTAAERSRLLQEWSQLIQKNSKDIATIMTMESGKPISESKGEITYGVSFLDYYAAEALRPTSAGGGFLVPTPFAHPNSVKPKGHVMALQQAVGVTALITPWNFPIAMITRKVGPALAVGCTAIVKPSERTPLTAIALEQLAIQAGIPTDVLQVVTASHETTPEVGEEFCTNELVNKISVTGSTAVGKKLMRLSSDTVKRLSLELGGNAPFVVFEDCNSIEMAVEAAIMSKYRNAGQTCVCADRFLVQSTIHDSFVQMLVDAVKKFRIGPGMDDSTTMGPLITSAAVDSVHTKVLEAVQEGATLVYGGSRLQDIGTNFYQPTVLTNINLKSRLWTTETFGPVAAIHKFETEEEALDIANSGPAGLASYFCTSNLSRALRFAGRLECGIVGINAGIISTCCAPFGGIKESGLGREGSSLGLAEYLETKYIFLNA